MYDCGVDDNSRSWARTATTSPPAGHFVSYAVAQEQTVAFERLLSERGIRIKPGSQLEAACLLTMELREQQLSPSRRAPAAALRNDLRQVVGLLQLVRLLLRAQAHPDFDHLFRHLRVLNEGSPTQNTPAPQGDQASNKLFELLVALATMNSGQDVRLDDPENPDGKNPDVLATMPDGRRWGFACKVIHGDAPMTLFERIIDGVAQIERSEAEVGLVVANFKNRLPHDELLPLMPPDPETGEVFIGAHVHEGAVAARLAEFVERRTTEMARQVSQTEVIAAFRAKKALPGLLVVAEAAAGILTPRGPSPSMVGFLQLTTFEAPGEPTLFTPEVERVLKCMNDALQLR
jgi:hypothetical protein